MSGAPVEVAESPAIFTVQEPFGIVLIVFVESYEAFLFRDLYCVNLGLVSLIQDDLYANGWF